MIPDRIGRYRIEGLIGHGGMGEVFLARDEDLQRKVAVKSLPTRLSGSDDLRDRLLAEARTVAGLSHPAIAQIYDVISDGEQQHLVFEYVRGSTLASLVRTGALPLEAGLRLARDIVDGLQAAHSNGVVHRDLKAENVMVTPAGRAKILDFGLARALELGGIEGADQSPDARGLAGTLGAMSPEQVERRPLDHRSDLFSLGTLLYHMFTGEHPFRTGLPVETMHRIANWDPPPPIEIATDMPARLSKLIMKLLMKRVDDRIQDAAEVAAELHACWLDHETKRARDARSPRLGTWRWAATVMAALVAAVVSIGLWRVLQAPPPPPSLAVAVVRPEAPEPDVHSRQGTVAAAVRLAAINTLASLDAVQVINTTDVDPIPGGPREVARAVAADEMVVSRLVATPTTYRLELSRLDGTRGNILWSGQLEIPVDDLRLASEAVAALMRRAYGERGVRPGAFEISATPEAYEAFLVTRDKVLNPAPDVSWPELLGELETIRRRSPGLLNAYSLEASVARFLYQVTRDDRYRKNAEEVIRAARRIAPHDLRTLLAAAELAVAVGPVELADQALGELRRLEPANLAALALAAQLEARRGNPERARELLRELSERSPSWRNLLNLAKMERSQGDVDGARRTLERALERAPGMVMIRAEFAFLELSNGDLDRAEALFLEVVAQSPQPQYLSDLGTTQMLLGKHGDAMASFERAIALGSDAPVTLLNLADSLQLRGEAGRATAVYQRVVEALAGDEDATASDLVVRAQALAQLGRQEEARAAVAALLTLAPDSSDAHYTAALVYALAGETAAAAHHHLEAIDRGLDARWFELPWFDSLRGAAGSR